MIIAIHRGSHVEYCDHCPFHATKANGMGVCGHEGLDANVEIYCDFLNTPAEHHNPSGRCPLMREPVDGVTIEMER